MESAGILDRPLQSLSDNRTARLIFENDLTEYITNNLDLSGQKLLQELVFFYFEQER